MSDNTASGDTWRDYEWQHSKWRHLKGLCVTTQQVGTLGGTMSDNTASGDTWRDL